MSFDLSSFLSVVFSLIIIEVLLSVDNALVNASLARSLPKSQQERAVRIGIMFGALFRLVALLSVSIIIKNIWLKTIGALYLVYLAINHLSESEHHNKTKQRKEHSFKKVILHIALADLAFGIDNVITAVGLSDNIAYIVTGVMIGIAAMVFLSPKMLKVIDKFPALASTAYVIVGLIGVMMLIENFTHIHIVEYQKFLIIIGVVVLTLLYERNVRLRRFLQPGLRLSRHGFTIIDNSIRTVLRMFVVTPKSH